MGSTGKISADGGISESSVTGSGSGGSIVIKAHSVFHHGLISVVGGDAFGEESTGAAGGGGRVSIQVGNLLAVAIYLH